MIQQVFINGTLVPVSGINVEAAIESAQFKDWVAGLDPRFNVRSIEFQSVDLANHSRNPQVRFIKFKAEVVDAYGRPFAGVVFMRGGSVAILVILECEGDEYTVLTLQPRFPTGNFAFPEIPAGTLENDGSFAGGAARELEEETGIKITEDKLVDLTLLAYGNRFKGAFPTAGGSDEFLRLFVFRQKVSMEYLKGLQGQCTGLAHENEQITLKVIRLADLPFEVPDVKALSALMLYHVCQAKKLI